MAGREIASSLKDAAAREAEQGAKKAAKVQRADSLRRVSAPALEPDRVLPGPWGPRLEARQLAG